MDAVLDLTAQAAAYIGVIQQLCVDHALEIKEEGKIFNLLNPSDMVLSVLNKYALHNEKFTERSVQLIWISNPNANSKQVAQCFLKRAKALLKWLWLDDNQAAFYKKDELQNYIPWPDNIFKPDNRTEASLHETTFNVLENDHAIVGDEKDALHHKLTTPDAWRNLISKFLYKYPHQRTTLARSIHYMPVQIVAAAGGGQCSRLTQRILQEWQISDDELAFIAAAKDISLLKGCKSFDPQLAESLLENQVLLASYLKEVNALPFEFVLNEELTEIKANRVMRQQELMLINTHQAKPTNGSAKSTTLKVTPQVTEPGTPTNLSDSKQFASNPPPDEGDPMLDAKYMQLNALAFSGGGIRSATFNLGILQGLAKAGHLSKFDYLSTVSGGGYIGSWLVSWIKREASLIKVSDRLNPQKSTDPMGDEVRPIRWLRMYSNYLTPNAGIMSVDSWTIGMTVIRNMLLNQLIILPLFFTLLLSGRLLFIIWTGNLIKIPDIWVFVSSSVLIIGGSILAGAGMHFYTKNRRNNPDGAKFIRTKRIKVSNYLLAMSYVAALGVSAWFYSKGFPAPSGKTTGFVKALETLAPSAAIVFVGLLLVAVLGRYDECIPNTRYKKVTGYIFIVVFSALAAAIGCVLLTSAWRIIAQLQHTTLAHVQKGFPVYGNALAFTFGPPLVLEVLSLTIVIRMALLGIYFPDERREWWGRMGGIVHRIALLWILVAGATLIGKVVLYNQITEQSIPKVVAAAGGWAALVLGAVKAAFSSKSSDKDEPGMLPSLLDMLARIGPYLFGLGLLIFLPLLLNKFLDRFYPHTQESVYTILVMTMALAAVTILLSWRIGVNEFSMHHFYRNRLVRAYLGGTRNRADRKSSSSPFTGFDVNDDVRLSELTNSQKYYGPYPILNTALNASQALDLARQDRKAESFIFSPLYCGFDFSRKRASTNAYEKSYDYGYRSTHGYAYPPEGPHLGSAMAISGAAANPNQGYHSSPTTAFLLTAFNVRLGWWIGNPRRGTWRSSDPELGLSYLVSNLIGRSNTNDRYISLSDGGHFDNMGLYEMVRRRVSLIILGDAEQDDKFTCEGLANTIRRCRVDFGVEIDMDVTPITNRVNNMSAKSYAVGKIVYPGEPLHSGVLIYLKSSITQNQSVDVREYAIKNPSFPHQTTGDQFFNESQFESYRKLGLNIIEAALADKQIETILNQVNLQLTGIPGKLPTEI